MLPIYLKPAARQTGENLVHLKSRDNKFLTHDPDNLLSAYTKRSFSYVNIKSTQPTQSPPIRKPLSTENEICTAYLHLEYDQSARISETPAMP